MLTAIATAAADYFNISLPHYSLQSMLHNETCSHAAIQQQPARSEIAIVWKWAFV